MKRPRRCMSAECPSLGTWGESNRNVGRGPFLCRHGEGSGDRQSAWTLLLCVFLSSLVGRRAQPYSLSPAILHTSFHSWAVTGCTERREYLTSAISLSFGSALTAASVTGLGTGFTAFTSTALNTPFSSVGSG